jgi:hypothetical protein
VTARLVKLLLQQLACASDGETNWLVKLLLQQLACASDGETNWPVKLLLQQLACASDGKTDWLVKLLLQQLACASDSEAGWLDEHWWSWLPVLLLVDSLLRCSVDVDVAVTDASARQCANQWALLPW